MKKLATASSIFIFISSSSTGEPLCSQPIRGNVRRIGRMFPEHAERSFLDPEYSFIAVGRILRTIFAKQKFAQLKTNYIRRILPVMFVNKCSPNRRSSEIQGTALGKSLRAWTCIYIYIYIYRSMPAGVAQSRHAFVWGTVSTWGRWRIPVNKRQRRHQKCRPSTHCSWGTHWILGSPSW